MLTEPRGQEGLVRVGKGSAPRREQKRWLGGEDTGPVPEEWNCTPGMEPEAMEAQG